MNVKVEKVDIEVVSGSGNACGSCHKPIAEGAGVTFGRPHLSVPGINICRRCVGIALAVLGPEPISTREGRC